MKTVGTTKKFGKDLLLMQRRRKDLGKIQSVISDLAAEVPLSAAQRDHKLIGNWVDRRCCHIEPDWLLLYFSDKTSIILERTGTHSDLFGK